MIYNTVAPKVAEVIEAGFNPGDTFSTEALHARALALGTKSLSLTQVCNAISNAFRSPKNPIRKVARIKKEGGRLRCQRRPVPRAVAPIENKITNLAGELNRIIDENKKMKELIHTFIYDFGRLV